MPPPEDVPPSAAPSRRRVAATEPLDVDGLRTMAIGSALWGLAFLVLLPFAGHLHATGHLWVLWTCLAGLGGGLVGWEYCRRRRNARRAQETPG